MKTVYDAAAIAAMDKDFRTQFINHLSGYKSANVIGTVSELGLGGSNLAIFSSVVHLGANPALVGMISRPFAENVSRHTYNNLTSTGYYTINHVATNWVDKAHQTSARYDLEVSEFDAVGLTEEYVNDFPAPFVKESYIKMGVKYLQTVDIELNGTKLIIGEIVLVVVPTGCVSIDGHLDLVGAKTAAVAGLDTYHKGEMLGRFAYAKK